LGLAIAAFSAASLYGQASVLTWHNDNARTGQNLQETILTPANVNMADFGKLFQLAADGKVDAQPLYVPLLQIPGKGLHNVLFVMSEHDTAYAFDADAGTPLWSVTLLGSNETPSDSRNCSQVIPEIGITATPAIDLQMGPHGTIYVVAMSKDGNGTYHQRVHALDLTTGNEEFGGPMEVQATYPGSGAEGNGTLLTFSAAQHEERSGLVIANGVLYTSWTSHCDISPYTSWVIGYSESTLAQVSVLNLTPNGSGGGIWGAGAGPAADAGGNLYILLGNGTFDTTLTAGFPDRGDYGNGFIKLSTAGGGLSVADYFTMSDTVAESDADQDLGSGGDLLLPALNDSHGVTRALGVGAGKDGNIYVVDRDNMGKFSPGGNAIFQELAGALSGGVWSAPAWFNGRLYYGPQSGHLLSFAFSNGAFGATPSSHSATSFPYPGATPSISANGTSNGIVWAVENSGSAVLHAYDANNLATELYNSAQAPNQRDAFGAGNKFIVPTIVNGKVYVGTTSGVGVFGQLPGTSMPHLTIVKTHTGNFTQGQNGAAYTITVSNSGTAATNGPVTVTENPPAGLAVAGMSGASWNCPGDNTCSRSDALNPGQAYPAITVTAMVAGNAASSITNQATVSGSLLPGQTASDPTTILPGAVGTPGVVSVNPVTSSGSTQTYTFQFSDTVGYQALGVVNVLINQYLDGRQGCYMAYSVPDNVLYLVTDAGAGLLPGKVLNGSGATSNSQCGISGAGSSASGSGNTLTLTLNVTFTNTFGGNKVVYAAAQDAQGDNTGWVVMGVHGVPPLPSTFPNPLGMSPPSGNVLASTITFTYQDQSSATNLQTVWALINTAIDGRGACYVAYYLPGNQVYLYPDNGDGTQASSIALNGTNTIGNSQCTISAQGSAVETSGTTLTVTLPITFKTAFAGFKGVWLAAQTLGGAQTSAWQALGAWNVPGN